MGFLDSIFGSKKDGTKEKENRVSWIALTALEQLDEVERNSAYKPQLIFKHSTTCGVSRMVLNMFEKKPFLQEGAYDLFFLDLRRYREVSDQIAKKFQVQHESPQLLIVKNGQLVTHASHGAIADVNLAGYV